MFSQSNQHVSKAHAANVTSLSVPKESTNVLVQSIMFQKAHHLLLQHESFIRHINTVISTHLHTLMFGVVFVHSHVTLLANFGLVEK
jgi:hypothetical protein